MNTLLFMVTAVAVISLITSLVIYLKYKNASESARRSDERVLDLEAMVSVLRNEINSRVTYDIKPAPSKKKKASKMTATKNSPESKKRGRKPNS